jgi:iron complex outermembrane receptor protein
MVLALTFPALAQKIAVSGTVYEADGEPAIGASVMVQGSTNVGVATDYDGNFRIEVAPNAVLVVSYIGYDTQTIPVNGQTHFDIHLTTNTTALSDLVVVGYGTVKKSDATGSVAVVKPDEIAAGLATTAQDLLVGASPGVVVTTDGGNPNGGANIIIRGGASLSASNDPLIVIDGVPMDNKGLTGSSNPLSLVSPENVESMTILKDASATAIYGSRASNGVIIITTKKGKSGRPQVNFTANMYVNTPRKYLNMMDGNEFSNYIINEYGADSAQAAALGGYNTDWQKEALRTTVSSDYSLSVGGTAGNVPYRASVAYTNNNGLIKTNSMDRLNASINVNPTFFDDLLSVNANLKGAYVINNYANNTLGSAASFNPTLPVKNPEGNVFNNWTTYTGTTVAGPQTSGNDINTIQAINPISQIFDYESQGRVYQSIGNLQLDLKMPFLRELRANLNLGYDYSHGEWKGGDTTNSPNAWKNGYSVYNTTTATSVVYKDGSSYRTKQNQEKYNLLLDFYLNYNKEFKEINSTVDVTAGYSWQKFKSQGHNFGYVFDGQYAGSPTGPVYYYSTPYQLVSFFGRLNYTLANKYLVTATIRRDGTSRFSDQHRWGSFPSVALGWKLLEEDFMEDARSVLSELKIRGGYGITGQQDLGDDYFPYLPIYSVGTSTDQRYPNTNPNGNGGYINMIKPNAYNADIKWEETHTWNAGFDFGFLQNRITGSFDFYKRQTKDLLTYASYPAGSNLSNAGNINIGDLENTGIEFTLNTRPVVTKDFVWSSNINVAWNKNKITRLAEGADGNTGGISAGTGGTIQKHEVGASAYSFYVYEQVYDADGNPLEGVFVDRNADGTIDEDDMYLYHSKDPKVTLNWQNTFSYKNWDFGFTLRSNIGNWVYNNTQASNVFKSSNSSAPLSNLLSGEYLFESTSIQKIKSDYFVQNASFVRCDNITLGYTWPSLLNGLRLRLYGAVQNAFVITKYKGLDPEIFSGIDNGVYPRPVTCTLGIVATF